MKILLILALLAAPILAQTADTSPHKTLSIEVAPNVHLEVLDWGGQEQKQARPVLLIPGLGLTAHSFDTFAPKLAATHHVYAMTRRGIGVSSAPAPDAMNYSAKQLGDDVLAVIKQLNLDRPILIGHSFGGEELSSVGSRFPSLVAGLVYLDAAYGYAFYSSKVGNLLIDSQQFKTALDRLIPSPATLDQRTIVADLIEQITLLRSELEAKQKEVANQPPPPSDLSKLPPFPPQLSAMLAGQQKFTHIDVPILAIYAVPGPHRGDAATVAKAEASDIERTEPFIKTLQELVPSAHIVRIPHADHLVFNSNEAQVLTEIEAFSAALR